MKLDTIKKRSSSTTYRLNGGIANTSSLIQSINSLSADIGSLYSQYNDKIVPAFAGLGRGSNDSISGLDSNKDAIANGIDGRSIFIDRSSTEDSSEWEFSTDSNRALTLKESLALIYNSLNTKISDISITADPISTYTKEYIGEKAFDSTKTSSPTSIDARLAVLEDDSVTSLPDFVSTELLFGDGTNVPVSDSDLTYAPVTETFTARSKFQSGTGTTASGTNAFSIGQNTTASARNAMAYGYESRADIINAEAIGPGKFSSLGDCQTYRIPLRAITTNAVATAMSTDASVTSKISTLDNASYILEAYIVCKSTSSQDTGGYRLTGVVKRGSGISTIAIAFQALNLLYEDQAGLNAALAVDTSAGTINVNVTGMAGITYNWSGHMQLTVVKN